MLYTFPTFQNPTGRTLTLPRRRELLEITRRHGVTVVEDGPYNALRFRDEGVPTLFDLALADAAAPDEVHMVLLGTFSKVLAPGLRDAWVQSPRHVIDRLVLAKQATDLHSATLNQLIVTVPGRPFFADGGGRNTLRLSYVTSPPERIRAGVAVLGRLLHETYATGAGDCG